MEALTGFERDWLDGGEVAQKLVGIIPDADFVQLSLTSPDGTRNPSNRIWYSMVFNNIQLLNSVSCAAPCLGCLHASWGFR